VTVLALLRESFPAQVQTATLSAKSATRYFYYVILEGWLALNLRICSGREKAHSGMAVFIVYQLKNSWEKEHFVRAAPNPARTQGGLDQEHLWSAWTF
jgi:hypothetical protein